MGVVGGLWEFGWEWRCGGGGEAECWEEEGGVMECFVNGDYE